MIKWVNMIFQSVFCGCIWSVWWCKELDIYKTIIPKINLYVRDDIHRKYSLDFEGNAVIFAYDVWVITFLVEKSQLICITGGVSHCGRMEQVAHCVDES